MNRQNLYNTKGAFELKDISTNDRTVAFYLSKFDVIDSDYDLIKKGAFKKSIDERGVESTSNRKIQFLRYHDWEHQIGKFLKLEEDSSGLFAVAQLGRSTKGEDALKDYEDGIIREHSIGFRYVTDKMKWIEDNTMPSKGYYVINEIMLFEGSAVTFGANQYTEVVEMSKTENREELVARLTNDLDITIKALARGGGSDERLHDLEMKSRFISSRISLLAKNTEPTVSHSVHSEPATEEAFNWQKVMNNLKF